MVSPIVIPPEVETSAVVKRMLEHKKLLIAQDAETMIVMANQWFKLELALEGEMLLLSQQITAMSEAGEVIHLNRIRKLERYQSLLRQLEVEMARYIDWAVNDISARQLLLGKMGIEHATGAIRVAWTEAGRGSVEFFNRIPISAVENMVGNTAKGPLADLLAESYPLAAEQMTQALIEGVAFGLPPGETARRMAEGMSQGLSRIVTTARTETLRVYREASRQQYVESGAVRGYQRLASRQPVTCMACIALDGEVYPTSELMNVHPNDRCSMIPLVRGALPLERETAREWFEKQDDAMQIEMMGPGKHDLYKQGKIDLRDLATKTHHDTWGPSLKITNLKDLL